MSPDEVHRNADGYGYVRLPSRNVFIWNALDDAAKAFTPLRRHVRRAFTLVNNKDTEMRTWDLERIEGLIDDMEMWTAAMRAELDKRRGNLGKRRRIELLRRTSGRTPEEAESFRRKADQLEKEMDSE